MLFRRFRIRTTEIFSFTLLMIHKLKSLAPVIFLAFSGSALAQTGVADDLAPGSADCCWMQVFKAKEMNFQPQTTGFLKAVDAALAKNSTDPHSGFYLKGNTGLERDAGFRFSTSSAASPEDQAPVKQLGDNEHFPSQYDLFRNEEKGIGAKLLRASVLTQTAQITNLMPMIAFPDAFNNSCRSWAEAKSNLHRAWTNVPAWDKDLWTTNFLGHPYVGGFYYNTLRSQGASSRASFLYSTGQSLLWEFVIEAVAEQPSIQDLLFTSTVGSVIGELSHRATIRMGRNGFSTIEKILTIFINPGYVINNGFKKHHRAPASLIQGDGAGERTITSPLNQSSR
jgi:hypothetical protein